MIYSGFDRFYTIILGSMVYPSSTSLRCQNLSFTCSWTLATTDFVYSNRQYNNLFVKTDLQDSSINVRELRSAVLAALHWGPYWAGAGCHSRTHVQFHIDNTSAVSWANRRSSRNPTARMYNRLLSLAEFQFNLVFTASHIPGKLNVMADAGSRVWSTRHLLAEIWSNMSFRYKSLSTIYPTSGVNAPPKCPGKLYLCHICSPLETVVLIRCTNELVEMVNSINSYFATYCWTGGWNTQHNRNQHSTIKLKLASIRWYHRRHKNISLSTSPRFELLLQGIKRLSDPRRKKQPLTPPFLRVLYRSLDLTRPRQRLLWGSVIIGYFFLLRRSEFLKVGKTRRFFCLKTANAFFSDDNGRRVKCRLATSVTIGLEGANNDQYGRGAWRTMSVAGDKLLCPIEGLKHILAARRQLNSTSKRHLCASLTAGEVVDVIKNTARTIGVPAANYSSHSI
ncbi:hypothetical protein PHMEG_00035511 [Phytophthora megakarya]|uniref:Uncharacterized protein n=1 Tax=Phytophthora megakarya TaxID=4795 RepID=A0A225UQ67_9STRA|nr:hypothetical protein PHMEG_00035511 [Phytophthora megakarya]